MKMAVYRPSSSILVLHNWQNFKKGWDCHEIHKNSAIWLIKPLKKQSAEAALSYSICVLEGDKD